MTPAKSKLLDLRAAAAEYGMRYAAIYALIERGKLPKVEFPGLRRIYVRRTDLDRLIEEHTEVL
jgi:predicted DNA-binding transcriptional regulator AlpA